MGDTKNGAWWKGSFPTWIVALLLAICGFFLQRELEVNDQCRVEATKNITDLKVRVEGMQTRLGALEQTTKENHEVLNQINQRIRTRGP